MEIYTLNDNGELAREIVSSVPDGRSTVPRRGSPPWGATTPPRLRSSRVIQRRACPVFKGRASDVYRRLKHDWPPDCLATKFSNSSGRVTVPIRSRRLGGRPIETGTRFTKTIKRHSYMWSASWVDGYGSGVEWSDGDFTLQVPSVFPPNALIASPRILLRRRKPGSGHTNK